MIFPEETCPGFNGVSNVKDRSTGRVVRAFHRSRLERTHLVIELVLVHIPYCGGRRGRARSPGGRPKTRPPCRRE